MKFKVGDRVRAVTNDYGYTSKDNKWEGIVAKVYENEFSAETVNSINVDDVQKKFVYNGLKYDKFELVEPKKTKKERITELEKKVASLEERLSKLEQVNKPITQDVQRRIVTCAKTPNQLRKEIIEKAKKFIEKAKKFVEDITEHISQPHGRETEYGELNSIGKLWILKPVFYVNKKKRVVTVLLKGMYSGHIHGKAIAKCHPNDVFNEDIGKAIALGRALKIDVSEFEKAIQPDKHVVGMLIKVTFDDAKDEIMRLCKNCEDIGNGEDGIWQCMVGSNYDNHSIIIDDTNAEY